MYVIVGLGNPGKKYERTRHNMGFMAIDLIASEINAPAFKSKLKAEISEARLGSEKIVLVKPQTYMNLSGESVRQVMDFYKADTDKLVILYDDFDIDAGKIRIRPHGSAGTHNGMRSVIQHIGTDRFPRIRIGIGEKDKGDLIDFVIGGVSKETGELLKEGVSNAAKAAICIVESGLDLAMNKYNPKKGQ